MLPPASQPPRSAGARRARRRRACRGSPAAAPKGQLTYGVHVSLAPTWFDPAETRGIITPFMVLYALHDGDGEADARRNPGARASPSLVAASEDGLTYDFVLRDGAKFHNGDPVTAEDVKFTFERYRGTDHQLMKERVAEIETPDPRRVRFRLAQAVARLPDVLFDRYRGGLDRPEKPCREGRRGGVQEGAGRRRAVQVRLVQPRPRAGAGGIRGLLAQAAGGEASDLAGDPGRSDAAGGAEARRDRHRLFGARRTGRGIAALAGPDAETGGRAGRRSACISPTNGTRNRRGTTRGCARRPAWRSTATAATRR